MDPQAQRTKPPESLRKLMAEAIDYAGLFPPSTMSMKEAVVNYSLNAAGPYSWMLGRFVLPVARLEEFIQIASGLITPDRVKGCRLSVLASENIGQTVREIVNFNRKYGPEFCVDSLEVKASSISKVDNTVGLMPSEITAYFEITQNENFVDLISGLSLKGQRAKIRTGGVTPGDFPKSLDVIRFVRTCAAANVPFKATAGLHHPIRCYHPLTYSPDAPKGTMHGFLNLFLMSGFVRQKFQTNELEQVMEEEFDDVFQFDESGISWRGESFLSLSEIDEMRSHGIQSFGSCSFDEPVADLQKMGLL